jgi:hypothetical protein
MIRFILFIVLILLMNACTTFNVHKVKNNPENDKSEPAKGLVYYLPKTFLRVTPDASGKVTAKFEYLPDPDNAYYIKSDSYLSKHTLDIQLTKEGFLKEVNWDPDSTAVAQEAIKTASEFGQQYLTLEQEKEKEFIDAKKAAITSAEGKVNEIREKIKSFEVEIDKLNSQLRTKVYERDNTPLPKILDPARVEALESEILENERKIKDFKIEQITATDARKADIVREIQTLETQKTFLVTRRSFIPKIPDEAQILILTFEINSLEENLILENEKLARAQQELLEAEGKLTQTKSFTSINELDEFADNITKNSDQNKWEKVWSPVIFEIVETKVCYGISTTECRPDIDLKLLPVEQESGAGSSGPQIEYETASVPEKPSKPEPPKVSMLGPPIVLLPESQPEVRGLEEQKRIAKIKYEEAQRFGTDKEKRGEKLKFDVVTEESKIALENAENIGMSLKIFVTSKVPYELGEEHDLIEIANPNNTIQIKKGNFIKMGEKSHQYQIWLPGEVKHRGTYKLVVIINQVVSKGKTDPKKGKTDPKKDKKIPKEASFYFRVY